MSKHGSVRTVLAGAAIIALAGCGSSASMPASAPGSTPAGSSATPSAAASAGATSSPSAASGSVQFPIAVGNTWVYQTTAAVNGEQGTITDKVVSVVPVPGRRRVTMDETISLGGAGKTTQETYIFYDNGKIQYPVSAASGVAVTGSNGVLWPNAADLAAGRAYRSVLRVQVGNSIPARYQNANVTVRGGGAGSVSVPAGTFQATIVDMVVATKIGSFSTSVLVKTWTVPATGPVKKQVYVLAAGKTMLTTTEQLLTFTKGPASTGGS